MTASEHLNPDLFLRVYHSSDLPIGPHERSSEKYAKGIAGGHIVNPGGKLVFAGTKEAAISRWRHYIHMYDIPKRMIRPEIFADDMSTPHKAIIFNTGQPNQLFESVPPQLDLVNIHNVLQFRNAVEDAGSISHIMHKSSITSGLIPYRGYFPRPKNTSSED